VFNFKHFSPEVALTGANREVLLAGVRAESRVPSPGRAAWVKLSCWLLTAEAEWVPLAVQGLQVAFGRGAAFGLGAASRFSRGWRKNRRTFSVVWKQPVCRARSTAVNKGDAQQHNSVECFYALYISIRYLWCSEIPILVEIISCSDWYLHNANHLLSLHFHLNKIWQYNRQVFLLHILLHLHVYTELSAEIMLYLQGNGGFYQACTHKCKTVQPVL